METVKKNSLFGGAVILSTGAVLAKIFSAVYRIGLTWILGAEGIGLYQLIFPLYSLCVVIATAGLPMAVSKVVAKNLQNTKFVLKKCFKVFSLISLILAFALIVFCKGLATIQGEKNLAICYLILAPSILIITTSSILKGYFQGIGSFVPSAVSNIIEQFIKLFAGLLLCWAMLPKGLIYAIVGAVVGIVVSEIISLLILWIYLLNNKTKGKNKINYNTQILKDVFPITLTNVILPIALFVDSILVVNLLKLNFTSKASVLLYGIESGAVSSIINLPTLFSFSIASVLLPSLVNAQDKFNNNLKLKFAIKIILIITVPCVVLFVAIPDDLINLLYSNHLNTSHINGSYIASRLLAFSSIGVVFFAINQLYSSALQAINQRFVTIRNLLIGVTIKIVLEVLFLPSRIMNIYALTFANVVCYLIIFSLNHFEMRLHFDFKLDAKFIVKLIISNCIMFVTLITILLIKNSKIMTFVACAVAGSVYLLSLIISKIFNKSDLAMLKFKQ